MILFDNVGDMLKVFKSKEELMDFAYEIKSYYLKLYKDIEITMLITDISVELILN